MYVCVRLLPVNLKIHNMLSGLGTLQVMGTTVKPVYRRRPRVDPSKLVVDQLTGDENVTVVNRNTGKRITGVKAPTLRNLQEWLIRNPGFDVDAKWAHIVRRAVSICSVFFFFCNINQTNQCVARLVFLMDYVLLRRLFYLVQRVACSMLILCGSFEKSFDALVWLSLKHELLIKIVYVYFKKTGKTFRECCMICDDNRRLVTLKNRW